MMSTRVQVSDPLLGASPALRPTAQPTRVPIGATPPPQRSPLMELAQAFQTFNPELRDALRDAAAREEADATALGEIEATRARAEGRLAELDTILKAKVDAGELPAVRLPAAQRGASLRAGHEHAEIGLQSYLEKNTDRVVSGEAKMEEVVSEGLKLFGSNIPESAFYERQGFDKAAQQVTANWRFRVVKLAENEQQRFQDEKRANEGTELAFQLATASSEHVDAARGALKAHFDAIYHEMPKSEVNEFFGTRVVAPAVARLIEQKDFDGAAQLLEEAKNLKAGSGPYGNTSKGSAVLAQLHASLENKRKDAANDDATRLGNAHREAELTGLNEAAAVLAKVRQDNGGKLLPELRSKLIADLTAKGLSPVALKTAVATINNEYEGDERFRQNPQQAAQLVASANTLDAEKLDLIRTQADMHLHAGEISADAHHAITQIVEKNKNLVGIFDSRDSDAFQRAVFGFQDPVTRAITLNVGDPNVVPVWDALPLPLKDGIQDEATKFFADEFRNQLRLLSSNNPTATEGIKTQAFDRASNAARDFTRTLVTKRKADAVEGLKQAQVKQQAENIRNAQLTLPANRTEPTLRYSVSEKVAKGIKNAPSTTYSFVAPVRPKEELQKIDEKQNSLPQAEWDVVNTPSWFYSTRRMQEITQTPPVLDLEKLAEEALATGDRTTQQGNPERVAIARRLYAIGKGIVGFTPDEIKTGKTKHGLTFVPAEIDYRTIPVFRSVAELEKEWNKGDFTPLFGEVGDSIDPKHRMHPEDFYKAQLALLSAR